PVGVVPRALPVRFVSGAQAPVVAVVATGRRHLEQIPLVFFLKGHVGGGKRLGALVVAGEVAPQRDGHPIHRLARDGGADSVSAGHIKSHRVYLVYLVSLVYLVYLRSWRHVFGL